MFTLIMNANFFCQLVGLDVLLLFFFFFAMNK